MPQRTAKAEPRSPERPLRAVRGILLGALLSSLIWIGLAITIGWLR